MIHEQLGNQYFDDNQCRMANAFYIALVDENHGTLMANKFMCQRWHQLLQL